MSVSKNQLQDFAKYVMEHDALNEFRERVKMRCFEQFRSATPAMREELNAIMDAEQMFFEEINKVFNELLGDIPVNDNEDTQHAKH